MAHRYIYKDLNRFFGKAIHKYDMISHGDKIAVGLSGGKDSLTMAWLLNHRLPRIKIDYELYPIYIDPGFEEGFGEDLKSFCRKEGFDLHVEMSDFGLRGHSPENRENPCFLCSRLRRKRLFEIADRYGCDKLALGHNKDDLIETLFLNILYAGEISTMIPSQSLFQGKFTVIRPLAYTDEDKIKRFAKAFDFPEFENRCPSAKVSKRKEIKDMLKGLYGKNRKIKGNIFRSMANVKLDYLLA